MKDCVRTERNSSRQSNPLRNRAWLEAPRDAQGREVKGGSEPIYFDHETLLGGATPPPSAKSNKPEPPAGQPT